MLKNTDSSQQVVLADPPLQLEMAQRESSAVDRHFYVISELREMKG